MVLLKNWNWISFDTYIYRIEIGEHWFLKKFIVLYKHIFVDHLEINKDTLKKIIASFQIYIDSIEDEPIKEKAKEYFFKPLSEKTIDSVLNYKTFNDEDGIDDSTRKTYLLYLWNVGGQSGVNEKIKNKLDSGNITLSELLKLIKKWKKKVQDEYIEEGKRKKHKKKSAKSLLYDFHAQFRNLQRLLSSLGILPPNEDGYVLNEIGKAIFSSDENLTMAIWEHQKLKLRYSNPYMREQKLEYINLDDYNDIEDFADFSINPYIALWDILNQLNQSDLKDKTFFLDYYKFYISREAPFKLEKVFEYIKNYKDLNKEEIKKLHKNYTRIRSFKKAKSGIPTSQYEGFRKEFKNYFYGLIDYPFILDKIKNSTRPFKFYWTKNIIIKDPFQFNYFYRFIQRIKNYINKNYSDLYTNLTIYSNVILINKVLEKALENSQNNNLKINKLRKIKQKFLDDYEKITGQTFFEIYPDILTEWRWYLFRFDINILLYCYIYIVISRKWNIFIKCEDIISANIEDFNFTSSKVLENITGLTKDFLNEHLKAILKEFFSEDDIDKFLEINYSKIPSISSEDREKEDIEWINNQLEEYSDFELKKILTMMRKERLLSYEIIDGNRTRKRDTKLMKLVQRERMKKKIIMNEFREDYPINRCDACNNEFSKGEPECHHIVPFEFDGPDNVYNYAFLCKKCHEIFTHGTKRRDRPELIRNLLLKRIISIDYFKELCTARELISYHTDFLHKEGYIHVVHKLVLIDMIKSIDKLAEKKKKKIDSILRRFRKKIGISESRWSTAMAFVLFLRMENNYVMESYNLDYPVNSCDCCQNTLQKGDIECHHLIYKKEKYRMKDDRYIPLNGPESPYNYLYVCKNCHKILHSKNRKDRAELVEKLIETNLMSFDNFKQMVLFNETNEDQLFFLMNEGYISSDQYNELIKIQKFFPKKIISEENNETNQKS